MKIREIIILSAATIINFLMAGLTVGSLDALPISAVNILSIISSFLSPFITVGAIYIAYLAYNNQESTNRATISKTVSNTIKSDLSNLRESIDSISILNRDQEPNKLLFSNEAIAYFVSFWWIPDNGQFTSQEVSSQSYRICEDGIEYVSKIIECFDSLIIIDKDIKESRSRMIDTDFSAVDSSLKSLIKLCFTKFPSVFQRLRFGTTYLNQERYLNMTGGFDSMVSKTSEAITLDRRYDSVLEYMIENQYVKNFNYTPNNEEIISNLKFLDQIKTVVPQRDYRAT